LPPESVDLPLGSYDSIFLPSAVRQSEHLSASLHRNLGSIGLYDDIANPQLRQQGILPRRPRFPGKRTMILDPCASGGALGLATKGRSGFALRGAIERLSRSQGVFTIAAASAGEEAQESNELAHGVLTYALLAGLNDVTSGPLAGKFAQPSGQDRVVDVLEWYSFAAGQVPRITEKLYGQSQDVQTGTQGSSFPVLPLE
jgi:hypothetical protein